MAGLELIKMKLNLSISLRDIFLGENTAILADILSLAADRGRIYYDEIEMREDLKEDLLLKLEKERILIPFETSKTMAWEDRLLTFKSGELYEMPHVIRHLIRIAMETGEWNPSCAVKMCLEEIGEAEPEKITALFEKIIEKIETNILTPKILLKKAEELDLEPKIGLIIAELKNGGIISPCLRRPSSLRYEINPSLMKGKHLHA
jgi:hypothetical protein